MQKSTIIRLKKNQNINPKKYKKEQNDINNSNNNFRKILMYQKNLDKITASLSQSTLATNKKNFNINSMAIPMDSRYYFSTNKITKKLPLSKSLNNIHQRESKNKNKSAFLLYALNTKKINKENQEKKEIKTYINKANDSKNTNTNIITNKNNSLNININNSNKFFDKYNYNNKENSLNTINVKMQLIDHHLRKQKEKMNRTKFKFYKILKNNNNLECNYCKLKNEKFNEKLKDLIESEQFIKKNINYHKFFHFGKNELNMVNDINKQYIPPNDKEKTMKLNSNIVLGLLNDEDKKLIYSDPTFFLRDNKYLFKLTRTKFKSLINRFNEEYEMNEKKEENEKNENDDIEITNYNNKEKRKLKSLPIFSSKYQNFPNLKKNKTIIKQEENQFFNKKNINKTINEELNKRLKNLKRGIDPVEKELINTVTKLNTYKKKDYIFKSNEKFFKTYYIKTSEEYFKPYSLEKNKKRLMKEKLFYDNLKERNIFKNEEQIIIKQNQRILEESYNLANSRKNYK